MFGVMGNSAIMASVFGRGGRKLPVVKFTSSADDPFIKSFSCKGAIVIESIKDGEAIKETYYGLKNTLGIKTTSNLVWRVESGEWS